MPPVMGKCFTTFLTSTKGVLVFLLTSGIVMAPNHVTISEGNDGRLNPPALLPGLGATFVEEAALG